MSTSNDSTSINPARARYALVLLTAIYVLGYADRNIINLLLDSIKLEFQVSDLTMGLITGLGFTLFRVFRGLKFPPNAEIGRNGAF